jgi:hypothetical protein
MIAVFTKFDNCGGLLGMMISRVALHRHCPAKSDTRGEIEPIVHRVY